VEFVANVLTLAYTDSAPPPAPATDAVTILPADVPHVTLLALLKSNCDAVNDPALLETVNGGTPILIVLPLLLRETKPVAEKLEVAGTEKFTVCAPVPIVSAPPAADITTVPLVKVVLLAAIATPPPPAAAVSHAGTPRLKPAELCVPTRSDPAVAPVVKPDPAIAPEA
jgi:hypothetical protein